MFSAPPLLLCDAIEKLERLASALAEESDFEDAPQARPLPVDPPPESPLPADRRLGKEVLLGIRVLLPKLRTARHLHSAGSAQRPPLQPAAQAEPAAQAGPAAQTEPYLPTVLYRGCPSCED